MPSNPTPSPSVSPLLTPAMTGGKPQPPGTRVVIGDGSGGGPALIIGEPFGEEMILAVASPKPLAKTDLPDSMTEREFLSLFRTLLIGHGNAPARTVAAYTLLTTKAE